MAQEINGEAAAKLSELLAETGAAGARAELLPAMLNVEGNIRVRPFNRGERADGEQIGQYGTEPFYLSLDFANKEWGGVLPISSLVARGKPPKGKKKGAKARKLHDQVVPLTSRYYAGGWKEFRSDVGRQTAHVDLMLSGAMGQSLKTGLQENEATIAFDSTKEAKKARGNERRFTGSEETIFAANSTDVDGLIEQLADGAIRAVEKLFAST